MLDNLYLIAHKVRGEVGFDIAAQRACPLCSEFDSSAMEYVNPQGCPECDYKGYWWSSPTWGYRPYPFWWIRLDGLSAVFQNMDGITQLQLADIVPPMPEDARDVFEQSDDARKMSGADLAEGHSLLLQLGLAKPKEPIKRRSL